MKTLFYLLISVTLVNAYAAKNLTPDKNGKPKADPEAKATPKKTAVKKVVPKPKTVPKKFTSSKSRESKAKEKARLLKIEELSKKAIVIIKGKSGSGTGFVTEFRGKKVIITNMHVIKDNKSLEFLTQSGQELKPKSLFFAKDRDLSIFEIDNTDIVPLKIEPKVGVLKNSTQVVVYGNSLGESIVTTVKGTLQGTGPTEIEANAGFTQGNSGSPIIDLSTGKVIGVATRATCFRSWTTDGTKFKVRRFGTRIDNISWDDFQKYSRKKYQHDLYMLEKLKNSVIIAHSFLNYFKPYYGKKPDEFALKLRQKLIALHCRMNNNLSEIPELKTVYRSWNLKFKDNQDRLESARICERRRMEDPKKSSRNSFFKKQEKVPTDLTFLLDLHTNYLCLRYTIPRLVANGRKQLKKKPFHYEFFKRRGKELLDLESEYSKDYKEMIKHLTIIYKAKK